MFNLVYPFTNSFIILRKLIVLPTLPTSRLKSIQVIIPSWKILGGNHIDSKHYIYRVGIMMTSVQAVLEQLAYDGLGIPSAVNIDLAGGKPIAGLLFGKN